MPLARLAAKGGGERLKLSGIGEAGLESVSVVREEEEDGELGLVAGVVSSRVWCGLWSRDASTFA